MRNEEEGAQTNNRWSSNNCWSKLIIAGRRGRQYNNNYNYDVFTQLVT